MTSRSLIPALSLLVGIVPVRADEKVVDPSVVETIATDVVVVGEPVMVICTFGGVEGPNGEVPELAICELPEPPTCEVIDVKDFDGEVVMDGEDVADGEAEVDTEVVVDGEVRHYTGSEVERGDGEVDPSVMYMSGAGPATEAAPSGDVVLASSVISSGIGAVAQVQGYVAGVSLPKAELQVSRIAGDVVISD